ncbi:MAG: hypothetical protein LBB85_03320 [Dysgonamonadaceae bacterium]|jgi:hypothetical protein|nr:hypothetical protein [Dysgonamonadaceae bacterium]
MKKLVLFAAVIVAISLSACKKAAPAVEPVQEEAITVVEETAAEPAGEAVVDTTAAVVEEAVAE